MDDLLADFLTETHEGLTALDSALVRLERTPDDQPTLSEVFRLVHTIKGTCGFLGLSRLEAVAHAAENVLGRYRDGTLPVTAGGITLILSALDRVKEIVAGLEASGSEPAGEDTPLIAALNAAAEGQVETAAAAALPAEAAADPAPEQGGALAAQTIRVSVEVLEDLMTLVSELVLTRNQLLQLARVHQSDAFAVPLQRLSHITSDLQEGVMKTRMQPIGTAWAKLPRLVRDLAHELGKKIDLDMRGAQTELDRQVLELIRDPLTHMVRNSGDHGLETPAERRAAGKPETGRIMLNAYHEGGHIIIEIGDDGRGLPVDRIRAKALANGLATEAELAQMSEREILRFIFAPGFSTAQQVTSVSGRGVGMDVVKTNIEKIGGTVELVSKEGRGATFTIKIPLTLAIVSALIVEAGGERFALPQIGVVELVRVGGAQDGAPRIERIKDAPVLRLRDRLLPLVSLAGLLRLAPPGDAATEGFVAVMQVGGQAFGIILDRVFDTEEIVVKPVAPILRHVTMFSGNTILGDGSVIMILDPNGIGRAAGVGLDAGGAEDRRAAPAAAGLRSDRSTSLLLFRAGEGAPKAVPLGLVARLEDIPAERIEMSGTTPVVQYRGGLMPLVSVAPGWTRPDDAARQAVLVFTENDRAMGLMVEEILDVIEERLVIQPGSGRSGFIGSAVVAGRVTEVIDTAHWLAQAGEDWFRAARPAATGAARPRVLLVEDSAFFRHLVVPGLAAAGYDVAAVENPAIALRLREEGVPFDAVISDIEMPEMDGIAFAEALRAGGPWSAVPLIALSSRTDPADIARGRDAGFTDYVGKYDRDALLQSLRDCLAAPVAA
ncbi:hybrid sensor histidine kinase/response regulator [Neoroseomonas oryzicola]|uniref:Chemotaxis protein CheA n=1 Tax=Neoroseomonas oryzicola TaxID=535904 RepID=A0A9X9WPR4_9PROT|nr:chemotaxis protein CheW [Neoroseomonas oryzicola]MBR0662324.1 hybrid sensor histidine kinase/response regulator [Neoroseomonas oryzicola]NKE19913.1 hybrid sensor histidine kinase/response regulator [Neoroseomonas oryzicola]